MLRIEKQFRIAGAHRIGALFEAFNLFNRANVATVSNVAGASFGTPTTFFPGRELQIGIRYFFGQ